MKPVKQDKKIRKMMSLAIKGISWKEKKISKTMKKSYLSKRFSYKTKKKRSKD